MIFDCETCGKEYQAKMITQRFCSTECAKNFKKEAIKRFCHICGEELMGTSIKFCNSCKGIRQIARKLRFDVFNRDDFTCQYCGRTPKNGIILHVDHIKPVSRGGKSNMKNLITACEDCNRGKNDTIINSS